MKTTTATKTQQFIGTVVDVRIVEATPKVCDDFYSRRAQALRITMETDDGKVEFYTPSVNMYTSRENSRDILCAENDWLQAVNIAKEGINQHPQSRLNIGDKITVSGRVKKVNNDSATINYVKLVNVEIQFIQQEPTISLREDTAIAFAHISRPDKDNMIQCFMVAANKSDAMKLPMYAVLTHTGWNLLKNFNMNDCRFGYVKIDGYSATKYLPAFG